MASAEGYPVSIILEGPTFRDELKRQPQNIKQDHDLSSLRLVPGKSAAKGVHEIYFIPEHREWALVRLALRYRWILEVQFNRGMVGERQLLRQGFTPDDIDFLFHIVPKPPVEFSPVVYDMLWRVATFDEYLVLTESILENKVVKPSELLAETDGVDDDDIGFITRFLRSHLIERKRDPADRTRNRGKSQGTNLSADPDAKYVVTDDGEEALEGILQEYNRIFLASQFEPLYINPDLDPHQHLREFESQEGGNETEIEFEEIRDSGGVLGEIAESFAPDDDLSGKSRTESAAKSTQCTPSNMEKTEDDVDPGQHTPTRGPSAVELPEVGKISQHGTGKSEPDIARADSSQDNESANGDFSRGEVLNAVVAAASFIHEERMAQTRLVKEQAWDSVELGVRQKGKLWEEVAIVLGLMDDIQGRPSGRLWLSTR